MTHGDDAMFRVPTRGQIIAARGMVKIDRRLGRETTDPLVRHDAEWPMEDAAPYPARHRRSA